MISLRYALILIFFTSNLANAAIFYRHIPFNILLNDTDSVVIDYDFSQKRGIRCLADNSHLKVDFIYKGHQKSTELPIILESDHVPSKNYEELADVSGQFTIANMHVKGNKVSCDYSN